ncbi:MAG: grasp-with-spasm system SPASM domain peptide maturase [Cytophagia bacterium]|nr:MAG: grasp-with-spasm system SPASM domain peptide maturase [Cytophagales bacterium]TAG03976.1 MAG: grasp-with-spasm system SPASM domain peptide maturase [Cytophagia bacterium]TAG42664.1 MAG: grasp-with-spasm system SPASM domain peptide maturase [Cytophagia bacterium]
MSNYFRLFANCMPIKGAIRSLICDTQRGGFKFIPNGLLDILVENKYNSISEIKSMFDNQYDTTIDEYFEFLIENEFIFFCEKDEIDLFPDIDLSWDMPAHIANAIIDINEYSNYEIEKIIDDLDKLLCKHIHLRIYSIKNIEYLEKIMVLLENKKILSIEIFVHFSLDLTKENIYVLMCKYPRLYSVVLHSAPTDEVLLQDIESKAFIVQIQQKIDNHTHCGFISPDYFSINISTFTESQHHNTCLNRKISIDVNGEIKNCPSMTKSYGNIKDTTLAEALAKEGFKDMWHIKKDQIKVCQDCEFRHICTDCRAYLQDPNDLYSKPAKCSYDPYTATWGVENPTNNTLYGQ